MKVLFICYANVGRSQVAEACFRAISRHQCESAGIAVDESVAQMNLPSKKLKHAVNRYSVDYIMREFGVDVAEKERRQLVPAMIEAADLTVVIAEKQRWPSYLKESDKVIFWDVQDPVRMTQDCANDIFREVQRSVERLVAELG